MGGKSAQTLHALDHSFGLQLAHGAGYRHATDVKARNQIGVRRHLCARGPATRCQSLFEKVFYAQVRSLR
jgi:hypothetical protein